MSWLETIGSVSMAVITLLTPFRTVAGQSMSTGPTADDWRQDLAAIVDDIRRLHPDPFTTIGEKAFLREVAEVMETIPEMSEEERMVAVMRLVASLGDGHTLLEPNNPRYAFWYPVRIQKFTDGYFIVVAHESVAELAGAEVLEIAGHPADAVASAAQRLASADNPFAAGERLWALHNPGLMKGLGFALSDGELELRVRLATGSIVNRTVTPSATDHPRYEADGATFEWRFRPEVYGLPFGTDEQWITALDGRRTAEFQTPDESRPVHLTDRRALGSRALPDADAYYARMNYVSDTDFVPFVQQILSEVDRLRPEHLIIDWRQNFGGDGSKLQFMTREFIKRSDDPPWAELYVLTGPKTFSAAVMALDALLDHVPLTIVGEPSAAGLNHFGDPVWRTYERTGVRLNVSTLWWQLSSSDDLDTFVPVDVPAPFSFRDFARGGDPAVDPILAGEDMRSIPAIAVDEGGAAARRVWEERRGRFSSLSWFDPPSEYDLRLACDRLLEEDRMDDALETCRLNSEIHPDIWNVWYNLAGAQGAAGQMRERLASYRCVMMIAPNNWNVPAIRRLLAEPGNEGDELPAGCPANR